MKVVFLGSMSDGKFRLNESDKEPYREFCHGKDGIWFMSLEPFNEKKTVPQIRYLHWALGWIGRQVGLPMDTVKQLFKKDRGFIVPPEEVIARLVDQYQGEDTDRYEAMLWELDLPQVMRSFADLAKHETTEIIDHVMPSWSLEKFGIVPPKPKRIGMNFEKENEND